MRPLDREIRRSHALVVDGNPVSRSLLSTQLLDLGLASVSQASRLSEARRRLESRRFDIVVCEQHFPGVENSGQDLLDDLRRDGLLPWSTVFVMVTGEARYERVAEAAESALDIYLLKPFAATTLAERLRLARHRKRALKAIFEAIDADQLERAAGLCLKRFHERGEFWLYAARIGAELLARLQRYPTALQLCQAVDAAKPMPWARLGMARAQAASGQADQALRSLQLLITAEPEYADAHDAQGQIQIGQGLLDEALQSYRRAVALTPGSIPRLQRQGVLAHFLGHPDEALRALDRASTIGASSKLFDHLATLLLAFGRVRAGDRRGLQRCRDTLLGAASRAPGNRRLAVFAAVAGCLVLRQQGRHDEALARATALAADALNPSLDIESACGLLGLLADLAASGLGSPTLEACVDRLGQRFSVSKSLDELLALACAGHPPHAQRVHAARVGLQTAVQSAMAPVLTGDPGTAVTALAALGERTGNLRVIANAGQVLQRYADRIDGAASLAAHVGALQLRYEAAAAAPALGGGPRAPGSIPLRGGPAGAARPAPLVDLAWADAVAGDGPTPRQPVRTASPAPGVGQAA